MDVVSANRVARARAPDVDRVSVTQLLHGVVNLVELDLIVVRGKSRTVSYFRSSAVSAEKPRAPGVGAGGRNFDTTWPAIGFMPVGAGGVTLNANEGSLPWPCCGITAVFGQLY